MSAQHLSNNGCLSKSDLKDKQLSVLRKCRSKVDCLIFEMLFIKELKPGLNTQKDSVLNFYMTLRANTFSHSIVLYFTLWRFVICIFILKLVTFFFSFILTWKWCWVNVETSSLFKVFLQFLEFLTEMVLTFVLLQCFIVELKLSYHKNLIAWLYF